MVHPGPVICNASVVERAVSDFRLFSEERLTPSLVEIVAALDNERLSLCKAFGIDAMSFEQEFHRLGMVEEGTALRDCLHIEMLSQLFGPFSLKERHLDEDVPFGLVAWCSIGELLGVPTPISHAICVIASTLNNTDYFSTGSTLERLGIDPTWSAGRLKRFLEVGSV